MLSEVAVTDAYVRRKYERFCTFWPNFDWPEFSDIDFGFRSSPGEFGSVEWLEHGGYRLSLDPLSQRYAPLAKANLFHEMTHMVCGPKLGHGKKFYHAQLEALNNGAIYEGVI